MAGTNKAEVAKLIAQARQDGYDAGYDRGYARGLAMAGVTIPTSGNVAASAATPEVANVKREVEGVRAIYTNAKGQRYLNVRTFMNTARLTPQNLLALRFLDRPFHSGQLKQATCYRIVDADITDDAILSAVDAQLGNLATVLDYK